MDLAELSQRLKKLEDSIGRYKDAEAKLRKKTEEALKGEDKLSHLLFENMLDGFAYCQMQFDDNGKPMDFTYLSVNGAFETLTGLRNVTGKKVTEVIPGIRESDPELFEIYGRVSKTGKPERFEMFLNSLRIWFFVSAFSPERGYFVAVFEDITERKNSEERMTKSYQIQLIINKLLQVSLQNLPLEKILEQIIEIISAASWAVFEQKAAIFVVEDEPEVLVLKAQHGLPDSILNTCAKLPFGKCLCGKAAASKKIIYSDHIGIEHDNIYEGIFPHGSYCVPILSSNGDVLGVLNICLQEGHKRSEEEENFMVLVAEVLSGMLGREKQERELKETHSYLENLLNYANAPIIVWNDESRITRFNHAAEVLTGKNAQEVIGMPVGLLFPESKRKEFAEKAQAAISLQNKEPVEIPVINKIGEVRMILWNFSSLLGKDGRMSVSTIAQGQDITMRKRDEEEMKKQNEELERFNKLMVGRELKMIELKGGG